MSGKSGYQAAVEVVSAYDARELAALVERLCEAIDRHRAGGLDPFEVDQVVFQYSRAVKELRKFCHQSDVGSTAEDIDNGLAVDWWERGAFRKR